MMDRRTAVVTAFVLREAAFVLERDGWIQNAFHDGDGHCAVGAIRRAACENGSVALCATTALSEWLRQEHGLRYDVPTWNDANGRTAHDVIMALEKAAIKVEESL